MDKIIIFVCTRCQFSCQISYLKDEKGIIGTVTTPKHCPYDKDKHPEWERIDILEDE